MLPLAAGIYSCSIFIIIAITLYAQSGRTCRLRVDCLINDSRNKRRDNPD